MADRYDLMNDLMSVGLHRRWKNHFVRRIRPQLGLRYLDVAGGTGDIAFRIKKALDRKQYKKSVTAKILAQPQITLCDLNKEMLSVGRDKALNQGYLNNFNWVTGNAESLPVADQFFDIYTIAFGLRNVTRIDDALHEAFRVLRPGGRFFCLEFSHVHDPMLAKLYESYSRTLIPEIGRRVANDAASYEYLVESIRKFPDQTQLESRISQAGFNKTSYEILDFGVVAIHSGIKI